MLKANCKELPAGADPLIVNCVFAGNEAHYGGAGIASYSGAAEFNNVPVLANCTFSRNRRCNGAEESMHNFYSAPTVTNCILWGDEDLNGDIPEGPAVVTYLRANASFRHCDIEQSGGSANWTAGIGLDGGGNIDVTPAFENDATPAGLKDATWLTWDDGLYLKPGSPCIDEADGDFAPPRDIRGSKRYDVPPTGGGAGVPNYVDIGAYERAPLIFVMCWIDESTNVGDPYSVPYLTVATPGSGLARFNQDLAYYNKLAASDNLRGVSGGCWAPLPSPINDSYYHSLADLFPIGYFPNPGNPPTVVMVGDILVTSFPRWVTPNPPTPPDVPLFAFTSAFGSISGTCVPDHVVLVVDSQGSMSRANIEQGYSEKAGANFIDWLDSNYHIPYGTEVIRVDWVGNNRPFFSERWIDAMNDEITSIMDGL